MKFFASHNSTKQELIARTGFYTSLVTYALLLLSDALRPGFVARYFSPNVFFLAAVLFGLWWLARLETYRDRRVLQFLGTGVLAIAGCVIVWNLGKGFEEFRILMVLIAALIPPAILSIIRSTSE